MEDTRLIYSFPSGKGEEIQAAIRKYKGKYFIDLRVWFLGKKEQTFFPTKKGVIFTLDQVSELRKTAERLYKAVQRINSKENDEKTCSSPSVS